MAKLGLNGRTRTMTAFGPYADTGIRFVLSCHVEFQTETRPVTGPGPAGVAVARLRAAAHY